MDFYHDISYYYDSIFPFKQNTFDFLKESYKSSLIDNEKGDVLDVACGSGSYALALAPFAKQVIGNDLDPLMIKQANSKNNAANVIFTDKNMLDLKQLELKNNSVNFVYCIGNSIVHLNSLKEMETFLKQTFEIMADSGCLLIQIVNYNRILSDQVTSLPTIVNEDDGVTFVRKYIHYNHKIEFNTLLTVVGQNIEETYNQSVMLYPLQVEELYSMLVQLGFKDIELYGDFNKNGYNKKTSYATVVRCYKR